MNILATTESEKYCRWCMISKSTLEEFDIDQHDICVGEHGHEWVEE